MFWPARAVLCIRNFSFPRSFHFYRRLLCCVAESFYCEINVYIRAVDMQFINVIPSSLSIPLKVFNIVINAQVKCTLSDVRPLLQNIKV
jgi:hypothetical protein